MSTALCTSLFTSAVVALLSTSTSFTSSGTRSSDPTKSCSDTQRREESTVSSSGSHGAHSPTPTRITMSAAIPPSREATEPSSSRRRGAPTSAHSSSGTTARIAPLAAAAAAIPVTALRTFVTGPSGWLAM